MAPIGQEGGEGVNADIGNWDSRQSPAAASCERRFYSRSSCSSSLRSSALLVGAVMLSWRALGNDQEMRARDAVDSAGMIDLLHEEALMQSSRLRAHVHRDRLSVLRLRLQELKWLEAAGDDLLAARTRYVRNAVDGAAARRAQRCSSCANSSRRTSRTPSRKFMILSSGEVTPFELDAIARRSRRGTVRRSRASSTASSTVAQGRSSIETSGRCSLPDSRC